MSNTIAAISTPRGAGGISVVRISGDDAITVAEKVFFPISGKKLSQHAGYTAAFGDIYDGEQQIDQGVALVFRPKKLDRRRCCGNFLPRRYSRDGKGAARDFAGGCLPRWPRGVYQTGFSQWKAHLDASGSGHRSH